MEPGIALPDQLPSLTTRVIRGLNRLLCDPGLAPHHRVRLEIDLRHLSAIDLNDTERAVAELASCLPRIVDVVAGVSPLYLRLHTDLNDLLVLVSSTGEDDGDDIDGPRGGAGPGPAAPTPARPLPVAATPTAARPLLPTDVPAAPTAPAAAPRGLAPFRFRVAVGLVGLAGPPLLLAARGFASDRPLTVLLAFTLLCPIAAVVGLVARVLVHPQELPPPIHRLIARAPDRLSLLLRGTAASAWSTSHDEPAEG